MKYLKKFENHTAYEAYIASGYVRPNVSYCVTEGDVHYNPIIKSVIRYEASAKLVEIAGTGYTEGLHINVFSGASSQLEITNHTFSNGVGTIEFNGELISVGNKAFYGFSGLTSINITDIFKSIVSYALSGCSGMYSISIPTNMNFIGGESFRGCTNLREFNIPYGVKNILSRTFTNCSNLTSVTISNTVKKIDIDSFGDCKKLTTIEIPNSVTGISESAFTSCSGLTSVIIGSGVKEISQNAFFKCSNLSLITSLATKAPTISNISFQQVKANGTLYVPRGSTGYDAWMQNANYYLGKYNWTKVEQ